MKALCMVAHPDDCVIFGLGLITTTPWHWTIGYLTYADHEPRAREISDFWQRRNITTKFLGYVDDWHDLETGHISFDQQAARRDITDLCAKFDVVLTHDCNGDYGHLHHRFVHDSVMHPNKITFAAPDSGNHSVTLPSRPYELSELPLHADIVSSFHHRGHHNQYSIPHNIFYLLDTSCT